MLLDDNLFLDSSSVEELVNFLQVLLFTSCIRPELYNEICHLMPLIICHSFILMHLDMFKMAAEVPDMTVSFHPELCCVNRHQPVEILTCFELYARRDVQLRVGSLSTSCSWYKLCLLMWSRQVCILVSSQPG